MFNSFPVRNVYLLTPHTPPPPSRFFYISFCPFKPYLTAQAMMYLGHGKLEQSVYTACHVKFPLFSSFDGNEQRQISNKKYNILSTNLQYIAM